MAFRSGDKIVSEKLVLCIDSVDRHSNPGSGSTVKDLASGAQHTDFYNITSVSYTHLTLPTKA